MTEYVLVYTKDIHHMNVSSNLGVEGMESFSWQIEVYTYFHLTVPMYATSWMDG